MPYKYYNFFIDSLNELLMSLGMAREIPNLATMLKSRGYYTALSGKWHRYHDSGWA